MRFDECDEGFPTPQLLAEQAGPGLADLCFSHAPLEGGAASSWGAVPRALLQLAPFPLAKDEAAVDEVYGPRDAAAVPWYQRCVDGPMCCRDQSHGAR